MAQSLREGEDCNPGLLGLSATLTFHLLEVSLPEFGGSDWNEVPGTSEPRRLGFKSWPCHRLARVTEWLPLFGLGFSTCKWGLTGRCDWDRHNLDVTVTLCLQDVSLHCPEPGASEESLAS